MTVEPGWYPDPAGPAGHLRYYDGTQWTEHRAAAPIPGAPQPPMSPYPGYPAYGQPAPGAIRRTPDGRELASWGIRFGAYVIDTLIVGLLSLLVLLPTQTDLQNRLSDNENRFRDLTNAGGTPGLDVLFHGLGHDFLIVVLGQLAIQLVYAVVFLRLLGATPGKLMVRIRVENASGPGQLSWATALKRCVVQFVPSPLTAGVFALVDGLWPLGDARRQALHEKWAKTQVIRLR